ncbi:MAG: hypothetical protein WBM02_02795 [bacterium]
MKKKRRADRKNIQSLMNLIDGLEDRTGMVIPGWMVLDALASSCTDHGITVRKCCRRHLRSNGLQSTHYLALNDQIIVTCSTSDRPTSDSRQKDKNKKLCSAHEIITTKLYRNALLEFFVLQDDNNENR